jgi:hypothetical protein
MTQTYADFDIQIAAVLERTHTARRHSNRRQNMFCVASGGSAALNEPCRKMQQSASNKVRNAQKTAIKSPVILFMFLWSLNLRVMQQTCKWHVISMVITRKLNHLVRILTRGEITPLTIQEKHDEQRFR